MRGSPPRPQGPSLVVWVSGAVVLLALGGVALLAHPAGVKPPAPAAQAAHVPASPLAAALSQVAPAAPSDAAAPVHPVEPPPEPSPAEAAAALRAQLAAATAEQHLPAVQPLARPVPKAAPPDLTRLMPSRARYLISSAIQQQAPDLASCFRSVLTPARASATDRRKRWSGGAHGVLRLTVEPQAGALLIVDATVARRGGASESELDCARRALRNIAVDLPEAGPGPSVAMLYPLP